MKRLIAVLLVSAFACPAGALAAGAPGAPGHQMGLASHLPAIGTDVAAPDQQSPITVPALR